MRPAASCLLAIALLVSSCGDGEPPFFIETLIIGDTTDPAGPFTVTTVVRDNLGVASVRLTYRVGLELAPIQRSLAPGEDADLWSREIPGPGRAARIYYFLEAEDEDGNLARDPALAPDMYSFEVTPRQRPPLLLDGGADDSAAGEDGPTWYDASGPDAGVDGGHPDAALADMPFVDTLNADGSSPLPDAVAPDAATIDSARPDAALPDATLPDGLTPDGALPDMPVADSVGLDLESLDSFTLEDASPLDATSPDLRDAGSPADRGPGDRWPCDDGFELDPAGFCVAWVLVDELTLSPGGHSTTLLDDGRVLVAGGYNGSFMMTAGCTPVASSMVGTVETELFDPATDLWSSGPALLSARGGHSATLLDDDRVLVTGGFRVIDYLADSMVSTSSLDDFSVTTVMLHPRERHTATHLDDGRVLVVGGRHSTCSGPVETELWTPASGLWEEAGNLPSDRWAHAATLLNDGRVLVTGGRSGDRDASAAARLFEPFSGSWSLAAPMVTARFDHSATLLEDGRVLVVGGVDGASDPFVSVEIYDPVGDRWIAADALGGERFGHGAVRLSDGRVLVAGGSMGSADLDSAEVYDPLLDSWSDTAPMQLTRSSHSLTVLGDGRALAVGGNGLTAEVYVVAE